MQPEGTVASSTADGGKGVVASAPSSTGTTGPTARGSKPKKQKKRSKVCSFLSMQVYWVRE